MSLATDILKRAGELPAVKRKITCKAPVKPVARRVQSEPSGFKGVSRLNRGSHCEWRAMVWSRGRNVNLGSFKSVARAAIAYRLWHHWLKEYPEDAIPNKPEIRPGEIRRYNFDRR
ncbi:hypothetical protein [Klebsiella phage 37P2]|nr:hypothetical protein [Klebsiella phage 37P2]